VAVVQISKIQIRRGQKNSNSGVPQLSSAELAWAVDTQELYIGNGSVQEGAPYVGNTKILTEHDNILELASSYRFASDDPSITLSQPRTLLGKIDEIEVSVADFGAVNDGSTDCSVAFSNAMTELFRNADDKYKKVLKVPNGEYLFTQDLVIPSNAIIRGETQTRTILKIDNRNIRFTSSAGSELIQFSSSDRPENIKIENLTIERVAGQTVLTGVRACTFNEVKWKGEYSLGTPTSSIILATAPAAVFWNNTTAGIKVNEIKFNNCVFESNSISVKSSQTVVTETKVDFIDTKFYINDTAIYVSGTQGQQNSWNVDHCEFEEISRYAWFSTAGKGTKFFRCDFKNCGNEANIASDPVWSIISFGESTDNLVIASTNNRHQAAGIVTSETVPSVTEVFNSDKTEFLNRNASEIYLSNSFRPVTVFSALNNYITVNYILRLGVHVRYGKLVFTVGDDLSKLAWTDSYQYSDLTATSEGGRIMTNFQFDAELRDNDADSGIETIVLYYKNPISTGQTGNISFDVSYGV
jgi:hypothetical protein